MKSLSEKQLSEFKFGVECANKGVDISSIPFEQTSMFNLGFELGRMGFEFENDELVLECARSIVYRFRFVVYGLCSCNVYDDRYEPACHYRFEGYAFDGQFERTAQGSGESWLSVLSKKIASAQSSF